MNNLLLFEHEMQNENTYLIKDDERLSHISNVLNKKNGDELNLCLVNNCLGKGVIKNLSSNSLEIEVTQKLPGTRFDIKLIVGISRPPTIKKILEHGTSLGVSEFHFYLPELTEKSFLEAKLFKDELFKKHLEYGLSQSKVYYKLPKVILHKGLPDLKLFEGDQKYLLKMDAGKSFNQYPPELNKPISLVLGPERGLIPKENDFFESDGFRAIEICPSVLRVEIATLAALSQIFLFAGLSK